MELDDLDNPEFPFILPEDRRPTIPEPPPVRLVAVEDVILPATPRDVRRIEALYIGLLKFERDVKEPGFVLKAENAKLRFELSEKEVDREDFRAIGIDVPSLRDLELLFVDAEVEFVKERGFNLGQTSFLLRDPAGNWLRIGEVQRIL